MSWHFQQAEAASKAASAVGCILALCAAGPQLGKCLSSLVPEILKLKNTEQSNAKTRDQDFKYILRKVLSYLGCVNLWLQVPTSCCRSPSYTKCCLPGGVASWSPACDTISPSKWVRALCQD